MSGITQVNEVTKKYDVGGVMLEQPFKPGRLGHFGLYQNDITKAVAFYGDLLGFKVSDAFAPNPQAPDQILTFMTYGADHHSMVLVPAIFGQAMDVYYPKGITLNQISFQVSTLDEVLNAYHAAQAKEFDIFRICRDIPGSNWAVYFRDPDGHMIEIFYGMEQLGWAGQSKPTAAFRKFGGNEEPSLPQLAERDEIKEVEATGASLTTGYRAVDPLPARFNVGGVLLPRPFKVIQTGPICLFVNDVDASTAFYTKDLGFKKTEESFYKGHKGALLRTGTEHHSIGLFPIALRDELGLNPDTTLFTYGMQLSTYRQLKDAVTFLRENGCEFVEIPEELYPGIDYAAHLLDPAGHLIQLYYYMEQIGWDGLPRPASERRKVEKNWPETIDALTDTYENRFFQGPIG